MSDLETIATGQGQAAREARRTLKRRARAASSGSSGDDDFAPLVSAFEDIAERLEPRARRQLGRDVAQDLRQANAGRIRPNVQPDGEPMAPRKRRASGRLRSKRLRDEGSARGPKRTVRQVRMFQRAAGPKYLRKESSQGDAQVGFVGAMARIMAVHQYGQADHVTRDPSSPLVTYQPRVVLGITPDDRGRILDRVSAQISP